MAKSTAVGRKIRKLKKEGKTQAQAVGQALGMQAAAGKKRKNAKKKRKKG